jgi:hypothetical protein
MAGALWTLSDSEEIPLTAKSAGISFFVTQIIQFATVERVFSLFASCFVDSHFAGLPLLLVYPPKPYCVSMKAIKSLISSSLRK